jgi:DNA topoisomerase IA
MRVAQQLYEGIDTGQGAVGLITYMRTDSVNLAQDAISEIRALIGQRYGVSNLPPAARVFQDQSQERPGSARGDSPDGGGGNAGVDSRPSNTPINTRSTI